MIISTKNLYKKYYEITSSHQQKEIPVINGVTLNIEDGEFVGIMGRSGCGKTTLLKMLGLIEAVTDGELYFMEKEVTSASKYERSDIRLHEMGFIFQDYQLMDSLKVRDNIALPLIMDNNKSKGIDDKVDELANILEIQKLLGKYPCDLSGGEKQRVAIARALINNPKLVLADEPTGNLDSRTGEIVIELLIKINKELNKTIVMVTHDALMASYCDRVIFLKDGLIEDNISKKHYENAQQYYGSILKKSSDM